MEKVTFLQLPIQIRQKFREFSARLLLRRKPGRLLLSLKRLGSYLRFSTRKAVKILFQRSYTLEKVSRITIPGHNLAATTTRNYSFVFPYLYRIESVVATEEPLSIAIIQQARPLTPSLLLFKRLYCPAEKSLLASFKEIREALVLKLLLRMRFDHLASSEELYNTSCSEGNKPLQIFPSLKDKNFHSPGDHSRSSQKILNSPLFLANPGESKLLRQVLITPFGIAREELRKLLPPPFLLRSETAPRLYFMVCYDSGSSGVTEGDPASQPATRLTYALYAPAELASADRFISGFLPLSFDWNLPVKPWLTLRAKKCFAELELDEGGIDFVLKDRSYSSYSRLNGELNSIYSRRDTLPPLMFSYHTHVFHHDYQKSKISYQTNENQYSVNRVYIMKNRADHNPDKSMAGYLSRVCGREVLPTENSFFVTSISTRRHALTAVDLSSLTYRVEGTAEIEVS